MQTEITDNGFHPIDPSSLTMQEPPSSSYPQLVGGCLAACPVKVDGAPCLKTCVLTQGHYGSHRCSTGHTWS